MRFPFFSFRRGPVSLAAILLSILPVLAAAEPVPVPFTLSPRGHIMVPVELADGQTRTFLLDTAAGSFLIAPQVARELGLEPLDETMSVVGKTGQRDLDLVVLDGVSLGGQSRDGLRAAVEEVGSIPGEGVTCDGILGAAFLRQFDVRIDFAANTVTLFDPATDDHCPVCPAEATPVPIEIHEQGHILLPAGIGDLDLTGLLDTGSGHSGVNTRVTDALGVDLPDPPPGGHGLGIETGPIRIGEQVIVDRGPLMVMDRADIFAAFDLVDKPRMLVGTDLLAGRVLSISYATRHLYVE